MPTPQEPQAAGRNPSDAARIRLIEEARAGWISRLIDTSRRNNLLYYSPTPTNSIEVDYDGQDLLELLAGEEVSAQALQPGVADRPERVLPLARKAQENSEEKGLQTLQLAVGFATWTVGDGGRDPKAPIFLLPLQMKKKGKDLTAIEVQVAGRPTLNPVLLHVLSDEFNLELPAEALNAAVQPGEPHGKGAGANTAAQFLTQPLAPFEEAISWLASLCQKVPGFATEMAAGISNFSFAKLALVEDLKAAGDRLLENEVVAAIAGDPGARGRLGSLQLAVEPRELDARSPDQEFCVVDADSSQLCAIAGVAAGQNAVIHGPPGTGKSQTITNLIATLVAEGKKVLFVAEKRAALEVVQQRLERCGLDHLAMDLHGAELSPKKVIERIARTLTLVRSSRPAEAETTHRQFQDRRLKLNGHDAQMHAVSERSGKSVYEMQGALLRLPAEAKTSVRWRGAELVQITPVKAEQVRDLLREAAPFQALLLQTDPSPWTGVSFRNGQAVQEAADLSQRLAHESLPHLATRLKNLERATGFPAADTLAEVDSRLLLLSRAAGWLSLYDEAIFAADLPALLLDLDKAKQGGAKGLWLSWTDGSVKAAQRRVAELRKGQKVSPAQAHKELSEMDALRRSWQALSRGSTVPAENKEFAALEKALLTVRKELHDFEQLIGETGWDKLSLQAIGLRLEPFAADSVTPYRLSTLGTIESRLSEAGVQRLMDDLKQRRCPSTLWAAIFDFAWLNSALDEMALKYPDVKSFVGSTHDGYVQEFKRLDTDRLSLARDRVRRLHAERTIAAMNEHPIQEATIKQEAAKSRSFKPLRRIFEESSQVMTAVCPCWMASPLSVAQLIPSGVRFDYVIFDEASQILPEDAIPAILRGKFVVVAGDNKQLPPTGFFAAGIEDEEEGAAAGYESLLDMMLPFVRGFHLNWHYRSRDEALIAFSNHWMYDDRLVTFPGVGGPPAVTHSLVKELPSGDGQEESSSAEVQRVVDLVLRHAQQTPHKSLGVIAMGIKHAGRVQAAIDRLQGKHPELGEFFDPGRPERFFVKNLERVQGDERDAIILTVGYGKDRAGNLPLRFGPILAAGGRRRLNVAITRARDTLTLVSSFAHTDIDTTKVREGTGLEFLRNYLQFASSNGTIFAHGEVTGLPMNDFEADIYEALTAKGLRLVPQVGCSTFRIDFGVCHPDQPGRFVLAIEADGASYHSSYTARDRDRLRQAMLENLGWTFHRIWSTDWFHRRHEEIERTLLAYARAVARADEPARIPAPVLLASEPVAEMPLYELSSQRSSIFPPLSKKASIGDYTAVEMQALYTWVCSDGQLRTHDEIADEMFQALPFSRRGSKIDSVLRDTIRRCEKMAKV